MSFGSHDILKRCIMFRVHAFWTYIKTIGSYIKFCCCFFNNIPPHYVYSPTHVANWAPGLLSFLLSSTPYRLTINLYILSSNKQTQSCLKLHTSSNNAAINILIHVPLGVCVKNSLGYEPRSHLLDHTVGLYKIYLNVPDALHRGRHILQSHQ